MREILFRGKRVDNGEWLISDCFYQGDGDIKLWDNFNEDGWVKVKPETVGQYTGLKDKNGKKIFEGDIVIGDIPELLGNQKLIGVIDYEESALIMRIPNRKNWQIQKGGSRSFTNYKVIGNIHDNPELLEEK